MTWVSGRSVTRFSHSSYLQLCCDLPTFCSCRFHNYFTLRNMALLLWGVPCTFPHRLGFSIVGRARVREVYHWMVCCLIYSLSLLGFLWLDYEYFISFSPLLRKWDLSPTTEQPCLQRYPLRYRIIFIWKIVCFIRTYPITVAHLYINGASLLLLLLFGSQDFPLSLSLLIVEANLHSLLYFPYVTP